MDPSVLPCTMNKREQLLADLTAHQAEAQVAISQERWQDAAVSLSRASITATQLKWVAADDPKPLDKPLEVC